MEEKSTEKKYKYLLKNILLFAISSFIPKLLGFVLIPIYTGALSTEEYGIADLISATSQLAVPVFSLTIYDAVLRYTLDKNCDSSLVLSIGMRIAGIGLIILVGLSAISVCAFEQIKPSYAVFFILLYFTSTFNSIFSVFLRGIDKVEIITVGGVINSVVTFGANILFLVVLKGGLNEYLLANFIGGMVALLIEFFFGRIYRYISIKDDRTLRREMVAFSVPMIFSAVAWWINNASDRYIISWMAGVSVSGIYAISGKLPGIISVFQSVFSQAWSVSAVKEFDKNDEDGFVGKMYTLSGFCMLMVGAVTILLNVPLAKILYADEFYEAWKYVPPLIVAGILNALSLFTGSIFMAVKDTKSRMISTLLGAGINTVLNFLLIPKWGAYGAATATVVGFFVSYLYQEIRIRKHIAMKTNFFRNYLSVFLLVIQMVVAFWGNRYIYIQLILVMLMALLYIREVSEVILSGIKKLKRRI